MTAVGAEKPGAVPALYRRILTDLRHQILSGHWAPGHRIPFEHELSLAYGCSRMTVSKALSELARSGLIERRRRSGSFVALPRSQTAALEIHDVRTEVEALGLPYRHTVIARKVSRSSSDAERLQAPGGAKLLKVDCVHHSGSLPFCVERRLISLAAVPEAGEADFSLIAPGPWLLARVPWSQAEHRISATAAAAPDASVLGIATGAACLVVERRTWTSETPVTLVRFTYPAGRHSLLARFAPPEGSTNQGAEVDGQG